MCPGSCRIEIGCVGCCSYKVVLDSDWAEFDGHNRIDRGTEFFTSDWAHNSRPYSMKVYSPSRSVQVYALASTLTP